MVGAIDPDEVRQRLLERPGVKEIVLNAVKRYNERLDKVVSRLRLYNGNERGTIEQGISKLEAEIQKEERDLGVNPANLAARHDLDSQRSMKSFLENILAHVDAGIPLEQALAPLPVQSRVGSYQKTIQKLREAGVVVDVDDRAKAAEAVRNAADYQVVLLGSMFELPRPFSQRFIKDTDPERGESIDAFVYHRVGREVKKRFNLRLDWLLDSREARHQSARRQALRMLKDKELRNLAEIIVNTLPSFERVYLMPRNKTRAEFEADKLTPEQFYKAAFDGLSPDKDYFTVAFRGFDIHHPKILLTTNNSVGMRMHLYSSFLRHLERHGFKVKKRDITYLRDSRANAATGAVLSKSGMRTNYEPWVSGIPAFRSFPARAYSMWPDLDCGCGCDDGRYMAVLHERTKYKASYADIHVVALACAYMKQETDDKKKVLSPFAFPLHGQLDFEQRVRERVLIVEKEDWGLKTANRGEAEWLNMLNVADLGYDTTYTTDFRHARRAMFDMCFRM
ncbi:hypothetical protein KY359_00030 [Candidatus Woesearchaeota archaeon]|nr:hypothetical protein [Candidatus Woesearchaeota archaeon]